MKIVIFWRPEAVWGAEPSRNRGSARVRVRVQEKWAQVAPSEA